MFLDEQGPREGGGLCSFCDSPFFYNNILPLFVVFTPLSPVSFLTLVELHHVVDSEHIYLHELGTAT